MDNGFVGMAILLWLAPILVPLIVIGLLMTALPIIAGVLVALTSTVMRIVRGSAPSSRRTVSAQVTSEIDPWTRLEALGRTSPEPAAIEHQSSARP